MNPRTGGPPFDPFGCWLCVAVAVVRVVIVALIVYTAMK